MGSFNEPLVRGENRKVPEKARTRKCQDSALGCQVRGGHREDGPACAALTAATPAPAPAPAWNFPLLVPGRQGTPGGQGLSLSILHPRVFVARQEPDPGGEREGKTQNLCPTLPVPVPRATLSARRIKVINSISHSSSLTSLASPLLRLVLPGISCHIGYLQWTPRLWVSF